MSVIARGWVWIVRAWNVAWAFEAPARTLDRVRLALGLLYAAVFLTLWPNAELLFDAEKGLPVRFIRGSTGGWRLDWFDNLVGGEVYAVLLAGAAASLLFAFGVLPRVFGALAIFLHVGLQWRCSTWMDGSDDLIRANVFYLLFVPWRRGAAAYPGWPLRFVQLQIATMYLATAILKSEGTDWWNGTALYWGLSDPRWQRFPVDFVTGTWLGQAFSQFATFATMVLEYALPVTLFVPRLRLASLLAGVALHLGILATMRVGLFTPVVLASYLAFWDGDLPGLSALRRRLFPKR